MKAIFFQNIEIVNHLLWKDADSWIKNSQGRDSVDFAVSSKNKEIWDLMNVDPTRYD